MKRKNKIKRTNIINLIIEKFSYKSYLEIGVRDPKDNFSHIKCNIKESIDPYPKGKCTYVMDSDTFFKKNKNKYDIIFIDGLHDANQVMSDINNSLNILNENGTILVHDCNPSSKWMARTVEEFKKKKGGDWTGDVWKAFARLRMTRSDLYMLTVSQDFGVGIIRRGTQNLFTPRIKIEKMTYDFLKKHRKKLLNLMSFEKAEEKI